MEESLDKALTLIRENKFEESREILESLLSQDRNNTQALFSLADVYINLKEYDRALKIFKRLKRRSDGNNITKILNGIAFIYSNMESKYSLSYRYYLKLYKIDKDYKNLYKNLSILALKLKKMRACGRWSKLAILNDKKDELAYKTYSLYFLFKNKPLNAILVIEKAIENGVISANLLNDLGKLYLTQNKIQQAIQIFKQGLSLDRDNYGILMNLSQVYQIKLDFENAFKYLKRIYESKRELELDPNFAFCAMKAKDYDTAISSYLKLIGQDEDNLNYRFNLSNCYEEKRDYESAIWTLENILLRAKDSFEILEKLAQIYAKQENYEKSKEMYELILSKKNVRKEMYLEYAQVCILAAAGSGSYDYEAQRALNIFIKLDGGKNPISYKYLADIYLKQHIMDEAQKMYEKAYSISDENYDVLLSYGHFLNEIHNLDRAKEVFERALSLYPDDFMLLYNLGLNEMKSFRFEQARDYFKLAINKDVSSVKAKYNLARALFELKDFSSCKVVLEDIIDDQTRRLNNIIDCEILNLYGLNEFKLGQFERSCEIFLSLDNKYKDNINVQLNLAKSYYSLGDKVSCERVLGKILEKIPDNNEALEIKRSL